MSDVITTL